MRALAALSLITFQTSPLACRKPEGDNPTITSRDTTLTSAARFVTTFYSWYLPLAEQGTGQTIALHDSSALFAGGLVTALQEDAEAQARNPNEIVGLDGDPFLDAQDFCQSYQVGSARYSGPSVLVEVYGICSGQRHPQPDVIAELRRAATAWVFVNFQYPGRHSDLMRDLDQLRRDRAAGR